MLSFFTRMGYVKRKATTRTNTRLSDKEFQQRQLHEISGMVRENDIPEELVLNDQSGLSLVGNWTIAKEGENR